MSALTPLAPFEVEPLPRAERTQSRDRGFAHEMDHAKRSQPAKPRTPRDHGREDDPADPPPPEAQAQKVELRPAIVIGKPAIAIDKATATAEAPPPAPAELAPAAQATEPSLAAAALTPLEQAVHELLDQLRPGRDEPAPHETAKPEPVAIAPVAVAPLEDRDGAPQPVAPVREPAPEPPVAQNPSHVHLVIDEAERLVVTVAVRGDTVVAHVRGGDDATAAALARNAATLDHAMRARGLQLADFQAHREDTPERERQAPQRERKNDQPAFTLEETP